MNEERNASGIAGLYTETVQNREGVQNHNPIENRGRNRLLSPQTIDGSEELLPFLERVSLAADEPIYKSGEFVEYVYFPETAIISEFQISSDGSTLETALIGKEGAAGVLSLLGHETSASWAKTYIPGSAYRITTEALKGRMSGSESFQKSVLGYIAEYVGQVSFRAACRQFHSIEQRFCSWLLILQARRTSDRFTLTHQQIGFSLGAYRSGVTLIARELKSEKAIEYRRGNVVILDRRKIERKACDCHRKFKRIFKNYL